MRTGTDSSRRRLLFHSRGFHSKGLRMNNELLEIEDLPTIVAPTGVSDGVIGLFQILLLWPQEAK